MRPPFWLFVAVFPASALANPTGIETARDALGGQATWGAAPETSVDTAPWWASFPDSALAPLIERALAHSPELAIQGAVAEQLQRTSAVAASPLMPSLSFDTSVSGSPTSALGFQFGGFRSTPNTIDVLVGMDTLQDINGDGIPDIATGPTYQSIPIEVDEPTDITWNGSAMLNARWNVDLFGNQVTAWQASRHSARAAEGDRDAIALAVSTNVANAWYDLVLSRARLGLVREQVDVARKLMEVVELRYSAGSASGLDVLQQRQQVAATEALLPAAEHGIRRTTYRLALLLGTNPRELADSLTAGDTLPTPPPTPALGTPADLLRNRPDVAAAMSRVDSAAANVQTTWRDMLPTLGLSAGAGWQYFSQGDLKSTDIWNIGAQASIPLFNGGRVANGTRAAQAGERAAQESARRVVLLAIQEVEDAILLEQQVSAELVAAEARRVAAQQAYTDANDRYIRGIIDLTTVLNTLTAWQNAELSYLQTQRTVLGARIQLHDALGGPWAHTLFGSEGQR